MLFAGDNAGPTVTYTKVKPVEKIVVAAPKKVVVEVADPPPPPAKKIIVVEKPVKVKRFVELKRNKIAAVTGLLGWKHLQKPRPGFFDWEY
ncbi:hypothetical protein BSKO_04512 [Bryopsis sp. KO-2023]|nr:hypothetical protein BSKO_04512 [Bryopsis sp. KO-2023]